MKIHARGFTLIELVVTLVIVGVLAAVGVPSYKSMVVGTRLSGELNALIGALNIAQSEAQKRGTPVSLCPGTSNSCATNWSAGWIVLLDGTTKKPLLVRPALANGDTITSTLTTNPQFNAAGYTFYDGKISIHDKDNTVSLRRCIVFSAGTWVTQRGAICP
jgi:type IV fimbrial biogenesis protein FimT